MKKKNNDTDNVIYVDGPEEAAKSNLKNQNIKRQRNLLLILIGLFVVIGIIGFIYHMLNREYKGYKVLKTNDTNYENTANYIQFSGNLLKYTPDGVSYINANGDTVWTAGIDMKMPVAVASGNYAAVADLNGNVVCVFNNEGQVSSVTMPYTICDVDVANQGAFAVVLESEETNYINLYNKKGEIVYEIQTSIDKSGYPLDITISSDGEKLFTSYLNIGFTSVTNNLAAYNFGDVGQNTNADRMVGGYTFDDQVVPKLEFVDNDTVVAFGTKSITIYSMKEKPSETARIDFDYEIRSVFYSEKYIGVISDSTSDSEGTAETYDIHVYDLKGNLEFSDKINFAYDNIYAAPKEIIISGGNDCLIYRTNGHVKYNGKLSGNIISVVPNGNNLEYVVVYNNFTEIIKLSAEVVTEESPNEKEE
ncbi:MAG: hypothetical protein J6A25_14560 [Lachnospiraceae bacterium]|nr:hypothetical protein [Lachnospiraceae bacterium]